MVHSTGVETDSRAKQFCEGNGEALALVFLVDIRFASRSILLECNVERASGVLVNSRHQALWRQCFDSMYFARAFRCLANRQNFPALPAHLPRPDVVR